MIDARKLSTIQLVNRWVSIPDALRGADRYQEIARTLYRSANVEERGRQRGAARRAAHLREKADRCQRIADELRMAARRAELDTIDGRLAG